MDELWAILYEDPERPPLTFVGGGARDAAQATYAKESLGWSCRLFRSVALAQPDEAALPAQKCCECGYTPPLCDGGNLAECDLQDIAPTKEEQERAAKEVMDAHLSLVELARSLYTTLAHLYSSDRHRRAALTDLREERQARERAETALATARADALEDHIKAMCVYCRNEGHLIPDSRFGMRHEEGEVNPNPEKIARQYIPNNGEYEGWIHRDKYGCVHQCEAGPLHDRSLAIPAEAKEKA